MDPLIEEEEYFDSLKEAIYRSDVEELVEIYKESRWMGALGTVGMAVLDKNARLLARRHRIEVEEKEYFFYDFVHDYDKIRHSRTCKRNPDACLRNFARKGNFRLVRMALEYGATDLDGALQEAAHENHKDVVEFLVGRGAHPKEWMRKKFKI